MVPNPEPALHIGIEIQEQISGDFRNPNVQVKFIQEARVEFVKLS